VRLALARDLAVFRQCEFSHSGQPR
jgi:hypothetical protein